MNLLALKLLLAPLIIGGASLAGRRWGPAVSGWLIGLPLTSGPVVLIIALSHNTKFTITTVLGTLSGGLSLVVFCLVYAWLATRFRWQAAIIGSMLCFALITSLMQQLVLAIVPIFTVVLLSILGGIRCMPKQTDLELKQTEPEKWDIPARILIGSTFILGLTGIAPWIGARMTGLLSTIPLYTAILTVFAHQLQGPAAAGKVLRGLLFGLFGFASFYLTLGLLLERLGINIAFMAAVLTTLIIQGLSFLMLKQPRR